MEHLTGQQLEYHHLIKRPDLRPAWEMAFANELGHLTQGIRDIKGADTIEFIMMAQVPQGRKVTCGILDVTYGHKKHNNTG
jgi:hypothetical protein